VAPLATGHLLEIDDTQVGRASFEVQDLKLIASRIIPFIDGNSLEERTGREALFRAEDGGFVLYLSDGDGLAGADERLIALKPRDALIWINESPEACGSFWQ
jgi:hypothetical protein